MHGFVLALLLTLQTEPLPTQIQRAVQSGNSYAAAEIMARLGEPKVVARGYSDVTRDLYRT